jgi:hypothetical protein
MTTTAANRFVEERPFRAALEHGKSQALEDKWSYSSARPLASFTAVPTSFLKPKNPIS